MMRKRLLLMLGCVAAMLLLGYVALWLTTPRHRFTYEDTKGLRPGLTEPDVEALLGAKASCIRNPRAKEWYGEGVSVFVFFDKDGRIEHIGQGNFPALNGPVRDSFLDKLRSWLGI
jgi:hypothetical protein